MWYTALQFATTQVSLYGTPNVTMVDPVKKTSMVLTSFLTALTAGLVLLGAPQISDIIQDTAKLLAAWSPFR